LQIKIVAIGKIKEDYLKQGINDYKKRLSRYSKVSIIELPEEDIAVRPEFEVKDREAQRIRKHISNSQYVIALDRGGTELSSEGFAQKIDSLMTSGQSNIAFVIGGTLGLADPIVRAANLSLSLSKLTFTHQVARFILLEQLYRSFKIIRREPYHY